MIYQCVINENIDRNERGLRVKAERNAQPMVQFVQPNGGENLYLGAPYTITWNRSGPSGTVKLELLVGGSGLLGIIFY